VSARGGADRRDGRRRPFVAVDMEFFCGSRKEHDLYERWGWCGTAIWVAFMSACKRGPIEGRVRFESEEHMASNLGVVGRPLLDADGKPFTFREFFAWTGVRHWTRMVIRGTWPAVEWLGYDEHNRRRKPPPTHDLDRTSASPMQDLAEKPRSAARNRTHDRTGQDSTTTGGAVLSPESNDARSARSPQGARSARSSPEQCSHEVGEPCRNLCHHSACARDCGTCNDPRRLIT